MCIDICVQLYFISIIRYNTHGIMIMTGWKFNVIFQRFKRLEGSKQRTQPQLDLLTPREGPVCTYLVPSPCIARCQTTTIATSAAQQQELRQIGDQEKNNKRRPFQLAWTICWASCGMSFATRTLSSRSSHPRLMPSAAEDILTLDGPSGTFWQSWHSIGHLRPHHRP